MSSPHAGTSAVTARIGEVLAEYEYRLSQGEKIELEQMLEENPDLAEELKAYFDTANHLHKVVTPAQPAVATSPVQLAGSSFGDYELLGELGRGGMGVVYKARQISLNRLVALKMILAGEFASQADVARFHREAEAAASLDHAHIIPIYEIGTHQGHHFFSMKLMEGGSLSGRRAYFTEHAREAAEVVRSVAQAVHYAHQHGILHRDLKPGNVLLDSAGRPHVSDFGLARPVEGTPGLTQSGAVVGTPSYMAPEQASGQTKLVSTAADVYSLGAILYDLLTGKPPFHADSNWETVRQVLEAEPCTPRSVNRGIHRDLETVCLKCLRKDPQHRYGSAAELDADLGRWLNNEPIRARRSRVWYRTYKWVCRRPAAAGLLAAILVGLLSVVGLAWWSLAKRQEEAAREAVRVHESELQTQRLDLEKRNAATYQYLSTINKVAESSANPQLGWTYQGIKALEGATGLKTEALDPVQLRSLLAQCLASVDLKPVDVLAPTTSAFCLAFSPNGRWVAIGKAKGIITCWIILHDLGKQESKTLSFPTSVLTRNTGVRSLAFSPDGRWLAAGMRSGEVHIWDLSRESPHRHAWQAHTKSVNGLAFRHDSRLLVSSSSDGTLGLWACPGWDPLPRKKLGGTLEEIAFSPKSELLACATSEGLRLVEATSLGESGDAPRERGRFPGPHRSVTFSLDGRSLAASQGGRILIAYFQKGKLQAFRTMQDPELEAAHEKEVDHLSLSPDGALVASSSGDRTLKLWEVATGKRLAVVPLGGADNIHPAISPDGKYLATTANDQTQLYEIAGLDVQTFVAHQSCPGRAMTWSPDGKEIACLADVVRDDSGMRAGALTIWNASTGHLRLEEEIKVASKEAQSMRSFSLAYHPNGDVLGFTGMSARSIQFVDATNGKELGRINAMLPSSLSFARDGRTLWAVAEQDQVVGWSWPERQRVTVFNDAVADLFKGASGMVHVAAGRNWILGAARDSTSKLLAIGEGDRRTASWRSPKSVDRPGAKVQEGVLDRMNMGDNASDPVLCVALNPDETLAASGTERGLVQVVRLTDFKTVAVLEGHKDSVETLAFSPSGRLLATASKDRTLRIWQWNGTSFQAVITLPASHAVLAVSFSLDERKIAMLVQNEHAIRLWHLDRLNERLATMGLEW